MYQSIRMDNLLSYSSEVISKNRLVLGRSEGADYSSLSAPRQAGQNNRKEEFATILRSDIINSQTSEYQASVELELPQAEHPAPILGTGPDGDDVNFASKTHSPAKQKSPDFSSSEAKGQIDLPAPRPARQAGQPYQQVLLMPLLQLSMAVHEVTAVRPAKRPSSVTSERSEQNMTTIQTENGRWTSGFLFPLTSEGGYSMAILTKPTPRETGVPVLNSLFKSQGLDEATDVSAFLENNLKNPNLEFIQRSDYSLSPREGVRGGLGENTEIIMPNGISDSVLEQFKQQMGYIVPELQQLISQAFYESGIPPEELHDVSLALFLLNSGSQVLKTGSSQSQPAEKNIVISMAGIDAQKIRQLFQTAAPILHNRLEQIIPLLESNLSGKRVPIEDAMLAKSSGKIEPNSYVQEGKVAVQRVNADRNGALTSGLTWLIGPAGNNEQSNLSNSFPAADATGLNVITQIGHEIQINLKMGREELRVQLKPAHLGSITLKVSMMKGILLVDISAESDAIKSIIESHLHDLNQILLQQGIKVGQFNVSVEGNMSKFGSQGGMFSSDAGDSRRDARSPQSLSPHSEDETSEQESWFVGRTVTDVWM